MKYNKVLLPQKLHLLFLLILLSYFSFSQVGINTTTPQETLHVEGTLCVTNTTTRTPVKLAGLDVNGTVANVMVGDNLELNGNVLSADVSGGATRYLIATIPITGGLPNQNYNDFDIGVETTYADRVVFRLSGRSASYRITGIEGGTDGRHIVLFNVDPENMTLVDESANSKPENRLITLGNNIATSGRGTAELVYDGILQRWILIGFRD